MQWLKARKEPEKGPQKKVPRLLQSLEQVCLFFEHFLGTRA